MKWLTSRYVFPLAVITLIISLCLQCAWIRQLYLAQKKSVATMLESIVSDASRQITYRSIAKGHEKSARFQQFFLSQEWLALRQAFDELKVDNLRSRFHYGITNDSSVVEMKMSFLNDAKLKFDHKSSAITDGKSQREVSLQDQRDLKVMDSLVNHKLDQLGMPIRRNYALYDYSDGKLVKGKPITNASSAFVSGKYTYNLKFQNRYQLVVPSITWLIIYQMKYYLISSFMMLVLTAAAFYLLIRLMKNQQLYAQARMSFTSNMTHELQTPISTIAVALESISKYHLIDEPEKLENYINISRHELQRLQAMIEKVLKQEQMDLGKTKLQFSLFDVQPVLQQVIYAMDIQVQEKNAELILLQSDEPVFIKGDVMHISNVCYNLIDNALKYSPPHAKIEVSCSIADHELTISFKDNGPGINEIYQQQVFERFFRIFNQDNIHNVKGSGLGLHYVKQVVELHGGRVALQSKIGKGSNFMIILPMYEEN
ncbi:HAMP domain-containing histidine kinase [Pedobacter sp. KBS0701]|uniref:sensor histidine kinase n=1 Tax=Pedobacter sp. KBS0701 TaxID=2578106 RepID=UPI00110F3CC3|nr:HAMP domain-containing sensor histidine kinase [Pedobacter sp. KBS0701]QDW24675.1 HAMP domain-containing histidine kinase [Pedobacter sp. KBS0701]